MDHMPEGELAELVRRRQASLAALAGIFSRPPGDSSVRWDEILDGNFP